MSKKDFLVELGCEELPPKSLKTLRDDFALGIRNGLEKAGLAFDAMQAFAAPRRLAVIVEQLIEQQPDRRVIIDGPPVKAAFDAAGKPTPAALGFAKKNGIDISELDRSGDKLRFIKQERGQSATDLLPGIVRAALDALPIAKRMRWGASRVEFVRPVQWLVMLLGDRVVDCEILGQKAGHDSHGHRFHHPDTVDIANAASYVGTLRRANVIADFDERRALIAEKVTALAKVQGGRALIPDALLDEVTALVEWPVPLACEFESRFLAVPQEALISTMQDNQKYFCLVDGDGKLMNRFITVANIESTAPQRIVEGNQKVVRPRLSDAEFFFNTDKKNTLASRHDALQHVVFQQQLGSLHNKSKRIRFLAAEIARRIDGDVIQTERAAFLSKCDLLTGMVGEFPELQGIMGEYYALSDGENADVACAIKEHYLPAGHAPTTKIGYALAIADRLDTIVGIFGIGQPPTGAKDPFGIRRASIGILSTIMNGRWKGFDLNLSELVEFSASNYSPKPTPTFEPATVAREVMQYFEERLAGIYQEMGKKGTFQIKTETIRAVLAKGFSVPEDFNLRVLAVSEFTQLEQAQALAAANKRVSNILAKHEGAIATNVDATLLVEIAERALAEAVSFQKAKCAPLFAERNYADALKSLASLHDVVDAFFDNVMVNADDAALRNNRIALLAQLRALFLEVADISLLAAAK